MAGHSLQEPYKLELRGGGGRTFRTYEDIASWADKELEAWGPLEDEAAAKQITRPFRPFPTQQITLIQNLVAATREAGEREPSETWDKTKRYLDEFASGLVPVASNAQGQLILRTWQQNPDLAAAMLGILRGQVPTDQTVATAVRAAALIATQDVGYGTTAEDEKAALQLLARDFSQRFDEEYQRQCEAAEQCEAVNRDMQTAYDERMTEFNTALTDHAAQMNSIRESFTAELSLRQPATYWATKAWWHWAGAALGFVGLLGAAASIIGFVIWGPEILLTTDVVSNLRYGSALLIAFPALALFWIMKALSRIFVVNLQLLGDARLRSAMVTTFVSLMENPKNQMSEDDRILILQALFRPAGADAQDEGPPNWFDVMLRRMDKQGS